MQLEPHRIRSPVIRHVVKRPAVVEPSGHEAADDRRGGAAPGERPEVFEGLARAAPPAVFLDRRTGADRFRAGCASVRTTSITPNTDGLFHELSFRSSPLQVIF